ncbi:MAG: dTDP-glucose 4,6-dehydratase [Actinobacteria bacterium 13_1_20CM_3_71_11]|nr:MAG: dTDP-glucose 4,6-dehydratase [Actinobacteria bacterium 13_1_20CM_3_71_11]
MDILVTGGAGFIGSNYVRGVLSGRYPEVADARVTVLDKLTYSGNLENLRTVRDDPRFRFVQGDIGDAALLAELVPGHRAIVHFAAESHVDRSILGAAPFVTANVLGTQLLLDAARAAGVDRFVHVSTDEVYGSIDEGAWTEDWPLRPNSPYAASKAGSDLMALAAHRTHGMDVVVTRCSNNYGPYQFPEKVIPLFVTNLLDGRKGPLYGDGGNVRDWLHGGDHCRGGRLLAACGKDWESVEPVTDRKGHDRRYALDITKIQHELGYVPQVDLDSGLAATVRWYAGNRDWWEPLKARAALAG